MSYTIYHLFFLYFHFHILLLILHAHVVEPMEKKNITLDDGTEKEVFVAYALGNFISGQTIEHTKKYSLSKL